MSAETFTTAMFLITAVIAAGVLINAVFPVVYQMAGTFASATHSSDERLRTDFVIVATFASATNSYAQVYMKNIGSRPINMSEIKSSDVFFGPVGNVRRLDRVDSLFDKNWVYIFVPGKGDINSNGYWDSGETLEIDLVDSDISSQPGMQVYFQFILPDAVQRSTQFSVGI
jgi:flagellar protein FlaG